MSIIQKELTSTDIISAKDASDKPLVIPAETLIAEIKNVPKGFTAKEVDQYITKKLGKVIRRKGVANGVTMNGSVLVIGLENSVDKLAVAIEVENMFVKPLEEIEGEIKEIK